MFSEREREAERERHPGKAGISLLPEWSGAMLRKQISLFESKPGVSSLILVGNPHTLP